jgi:hypothetical protein
MRHHRIGRNARLGLKRSIGFDIHLVLLCYGRVLPPARGNAPRRAATNWQSTKFRQGRRYAGGGSGASGCGLKLVRGRDIDRLTVQQTREASMATMEELPFTIEEWDSEGLHRLQIVARASNPAVGWAAYRETVAMRPQAHILFRHGIRVMAEHRGSDRRGGSAQSSSQA